MAGKLVGCREKKSFKGSGLGRKIADQGGVAGGLQEFVGHHDFCGFQFARDVEYGLAFAHGEGLFINLPVGQLPENFLTAERMVEEVLSGNRRALGVAPFVYLKGDGAANHSVVLEQVRGSATGGSAGDLHEDASRRNGSERLFDAIPEVAGHGARC